MNRVQRYDGCFFFIDLDNFKKLNDTYGHQAGDLTLKVVADILQNMKRIEDTACRDGGEELVLILHETEKMNALVIAERIHKKIEEAVLAFEGKTFNVTLSGGIAPYSADGKGAQDLWCTRQTWRSIRQKRVVETETSSMTQRSGII